MDLIFQAGYSKHLVKYKLVIEIIAIFDFFGQHGSILAFQIVFSAVLIFIHYLTVHCDEGYGGGGLI